MSNKLRPCPFCGKETAEVECDGAFWWVKCQSCGASGHVYWFILNNGNARDIVIDNWNTRPIEDALRVQLAARDALIERLVEVGNDIVEEAQVQEPDVQELRDNWRALVTEWKAMKGGE